MASDRYMNKSSIRRLTRRAVLRGAALAGLGFVGACEAACKVSRSGATSRPPLGASPSRRTLVPTPTVPAEVMGRPGGKIVIAAAGTPANYDLVTQSSTLTSGFLSLACNGLLSFRNGSARYPDPADAALIPDLAVAAPEQPDATTYIFRLRAGVTWQQVAPVNGRAFVAADVKWHFERAVSDPHSTLKADFGVVESVEAPDEDTVRISLKAPYAPFLPLVIGGANRFILPRELGEAGRLKSQLIGTGPYILQPPPQNARAVFRKNPAYFKRDDVGAALPYADEVDWLVLPDAAARLQSLQAGQAQVSPALSPDEYERLRASNANDFDVQDAPGVSNYLYMRLDQPPFDDKRVRQAISLAFDRPAMIQALGKGRGVIDLPIPVLLRDLSPPLSRLGEEARLYTRDLQAAKQLLAAAGHAEGIATTISYSPIYGAGFVQAAQLVQGYLREIGIEATPVQLDYARYLGTVFKGNFEGLAYGTRSAFPAAEPYLGYYYTPGGIYYQDHSNDQELQALVVRQRQELDRNARIAILNEIQRYLSDAQYRVYDVAIDRSFAWQKGLKNYRGSEWPSYTQLEGAWFEK